ncbi:alpha/beta fold hydrolase [Rhizobium alvei]|uniref:Alpha/beta hydrolase n=1 Tax=Rhizobium alvei TaxID=1132659 RepID=A0ABT8YNN3_9HYPH|nr:alpha/beta hydrolase [Rhizobium alvei]MDO6965307.1 alpha/beta hydrolase [Rhizobium alvei]
MTDILHATPDNPIPDNHFSGFFESHDGAKLRYAVFRCDASVPRGTIVLLHGRNESIEKYFETIRDLTRQGLWVATFDWRGQGRSHRHLKNHRRGHARNIRDFERDLDAFLEKIVLPDAKLPFFVLAHSMGSLIALKSAPHLENRIERMVLCAPFVGATGLGASVGLMKFLSGLATWTGFGWVQFSKDRPYRTFENNVLTSDPQRFARNETLARTWPSLALGPPTARWIRTMLRTIEEVQTLDHLKKIRIPCLILAPSGDRIVPYRHFEELSQKFRAGKLVTIQGAEHELLQERDLFRNQALAAIAAFLPGSDSDPMIFSGD